MVNDRTGFRAVSIILVLMLFLTEKNVLAQSIQDSWNIPEYNSNDYADIYANVYFFDSLSEWDSQVEEVLTNAMVSWQEEANRQIEELLINEHGEDFYISNEGYIDERRRSFTSEVAVFYSDWENDLLNDYFLNRTAFLDKLESGKIDALYFQRLGKESIYEDYSKEEMLLHENREKILQAAAEWEYSWERSKQEGLDSFASSLEQIEQNYLSYLNSLQETENQFVTNLQAINEYKETVYLALTDMIGQMKSGLDSSCELSSGCQYRNYDGSLNEAGKIFSKFIQEISEELVMNDKNPDLMLTQIAYKMNDFLKDESNKAFSEYNYFQDRILTYQTGFDLNLNNTKSKFDLSAAEWILRNQTYYDLSSSVKFENWTANPVDVGIFAGIYDPELKSIFQSIHHSDYDRLAEVLNAKLGESRKVQNIIGANLYTDAYHFINNLNLLGLGVPFDRAHHVQGNLMLDGHNKYGFWQAEVNLTVLTPGTYSYQMGAIGYSVLYEMYDETSQQSSLYWNSNFSQLNNQSLHFENKLMPAISHWEKKTKEYSDSFATWSNSKENLIEQAKLDFQTNRIQLENAKENWVQKLEEEGRNGWKSWNELYLVGEISESKPNHVPTQIEMNLSPIGDMSQLNHFQSLSQFDSNGIEIQVGDNSIVDHFQKTIFGVNQYASVIQMNHELETFQKSEQSKLINQLTYGLNTELIGNRKLSKEESILIGSVDYSKLNTEEQKNYGKCYEDPSSVICTSLLKKEFDVSDPNQGGTVTISKEIYNGMLGSKDDKGEYTASKSIISKQIVLGSIGRIQSSDRKDFFTEWTNDDWESIQNRKNQIANDFINQSLKNDQKQLVNNLKTIENLNEKNYQNYLVKKESQENVDSFVQELAIAYLTGGMSGVKASLSAKAESAINSELAKTWVRATGGNEQDIQLVSMAIDFMKGRMSANKIKSRDNFISIKNPIQSFEKVIGKTLSQTLQSMDKISDGLISVPLNLALSGVMAVTKELVGEKRYNRLNDQFSGANKRLLEIKNNEAQLIESGVSQTIALGTGVPLEMVSKIIGDTNGQRKAKKADKAMSKNLVSDLGSQITGALGGIVKTAVMALGIPEDQVFATMSDAHSLMNAKNLNHHSDAEINFGYTLQTLGLQANWTKHQSSFVDLKDQKSVVTEIGKTLIAKEMAKNSGLDESFIKQTLDGVSAKIQKKKSDSKAQSTAIRQTVVNAGSIALTLGASGAWSSASNALSKVGKMTSAVTRGVLPATAKIGQVVTSTFIQTIAGSHEGPKGAAAGFLNGSLVGLTDKFGKFESGMFEGMKPGIGVSYSEQNGLGGSIGIGNSINNVSLSVSKKGNSSLQFSQSIAKGIQFAADMTTNDSFKVGMNYNPSGEGPRKDWNFSMMYDLKGSGLSGSIGYTEPETKLGLTSHIDKNGISTSSELHGVSIGTNSDEGFQMDEFNFVNQNINLSQDGSDLVDANGNTVENEGTSPLGDLVGQLGMVGGVLLGGMGLLNLLRSRMNGGGGNYLGVGKEMSAFNFQSNSGQSFFSRLRDTMKKGLFQYGESVARYADAYTYTPKKSSQADGKSQENKPSKETDRITKLKTSIIDDYKKNTRLDTEKKLYELKQAGIDTTEIEAEIKKKRNGKDVPMSKAVEKSLNEYKRLREQRSIRPIGADEVVYLTSTDALAKVKVAYDPKKESKQAYLQRLGDEICAASKDVDLSTDELVALHSANVALLLGENLMGKINYAQFKNIDGKEVVSAVNTVDADGFRQTNETDCIRYIGAVLYAAGLTDKGSFANLNNDVYLTPEEIEQMEAEYKAKTIHRNGVEYFRQAGGFSTLVSERLTTEQDLKTHKEKGNLPELKVGMIGITRKMKTDPDTSRTAMKSDHIYIVIGKKFNPELGVNEYLISESSHGTGVQNRWITKETNTEIINNLKKKYSEQKLSTKEIQAKISELKLPKNNSDYLLRSEFYELKPHVGVKKNEV
ncbi:TIGR04388 family protein [Leptospira biflexa]|uniref:TIGR04388 family protein n=1 Tax=Leptospira biflexa TaxID=172 RepID=UPI0010915885|nr:TIGR04388 family protein [Leptospira biflexa]TGM47907.1 TIGR04388 family protein [Leptospira biflexa]TGM49628.1 TIGR04388 family protein [Leptospira biflexa]